MKRKIMALTLVLALTFPQAVSANTEISEDVADQQQTTVVESASESETESETTSGETGVVAESETVPEETDNASADTAMNIDVNQTYTDHMASSGNEKWYTFTLPEDGYISVSFDHDYIDSYATCWNGSLLYDNLKEMLEEPYAGNETSFTGCHVGLPAGTYYLKVTQTSDEDANYSFKINYTASSYWETESNNSAETADQIQLGQTYYGSRMTMGDDDWYKFEIPEDGYISLDFNHDYINSKITHWKVYLYNADQDEIVEYRMLGNVTNNQFGKVGLPAGTYYLMVGTHAYSDIDYNFKVSYTASDEWEKEPNNDSETATPISCGKKYYGSVMNYDDEDWYKIEIPSDGTKIIDFEHESFDLSDQEIDVLWYVELYDANLSEIWKHDSYGTDAPYSEQIKLSAGTYYVKVTNNYNADVTYGLKISEVVSKPQKVTLKKTTNDSQGNIKVNWEKVKDAKGYCVYKKDKNGAYKRIAEVASNQTSYTDKSGTVGSTYTYTVRAYKKSGTQYVWGDYDKKGVTGQKKPAKTVLSGAKNNSKGQVNLTWQKVSGADGYRVYRKAAGESWKRLKDVTSTSLTDTTGKMGVTYTYTVRAYKKVKSQTVLGDYDSKGISGRKVPATVQLVSAKYQKNKGVVVSWKKTGDCKGYVVYRKDAKNVWKRVAKISGKDKVKYTDKVNKNLNTYKYTVRAYQTVNGKEVLGGYDKTGVSVTK